ncbi:hypothetical protein ACS0TY_026159 [Phlomoides rotata]
MHKTVTSLIFSLILSLKLHCYSNFYNGFKTSCSATERNRGEAAVPVAIKQKNMGAERKSRHALGDIGNLVTIQGVDGKPLHQVSRPVTRSFCTKLLANVEAAAADRNKNLLAAKGPIVVDGARPRPKKKVVARNSVPKKVAVKPKPEEVIETSPDVEQAVEKEKLKEKAACGLSNKPKVQIVDTDASDTNNDLAVVEYVEEIYKYYKPAKVQEPWLLILMFTYTKV